MGRTKLIIEVDETLKDTIEQHIVKMGFTWEKFLENSIQYYEPNKTTCKAIDDYESGRDSGTTFATLDEFREKVLFNDAFYEDEDDEDDDGDNDGDNDAD